MDEEIKMLRGSTAREACQYLGMRLRNIRKVAAQSQDEFAQWVGEPLRTYKRLETHGKGSLETFVQVLHAVGRAHYLFMLFPQLGPANITAPLVQRLEQLRPTKFI